MSKTLTVSFSDTEIKRHLSNDNVRQLKDPRFPLRLRFNLKREKASWFIIKYANNKTIWRKLGNWPHLTTKEVLKIWPGINAKLTCDLDRENLISSFNLICELLNWYKERALSDRNLSQTRKIAIKSAIEKHLSTSIGEIPLSSINHRLLDEKLFWPLQSKYALSYVRAIWSVLKQAFKRANKLKLLESDPVSSYQFSDFIEAPILPKPCAIRSDEIALLLSDLRLIKHDKLMLILMMLLHGTRVGETRKARWEHISFSERKWFIPESHTKTKQEHTLPLTDHCIVLLKLYREQQREKGYEGVSLFPNSTKRNPINQKQATAFIQSASGGLWQSHDLRKAARTIWMDLGVDYMVGELLLNHAMSKLDQAYIHTFAEAQKRKALERYHDWLHLQGFFFFIESDSETITRQFERSIHQNTFSQSLL